VTCLQAIEILTSQREATCRTIAKSRNTEGRVRGRRGITTPRVMSKKLRSPKSQSYPETFSSVEVSEITGVSLRQLQWWDEQGVVSPVQQGHKRMYQFHEVMEVGLITELRHKGVSLQRIRKVLRFLQRELGKGLSDALTNGGEVHLLTDGKKLYLEDNHKNIIDILKNSRQPIISVCITDQIKRLTADGTLKKIMRSEKRAAAAGRSRHAS